MASAGLQASTSLSATRCEETSASTSHRAPILAGLLVLALVSRGVSLGIGQLDGLAWLCHLATVAMVIGLVAGSPRVVAGAWLFHLVWGAPMWLLDAAHAREILLSSVAAHGGPLVLGGWWLLRRPWPGPIALPAWMVGVAAMVVARPLTDPAHNVNAAYVVWPPLDRISTSVPVMWMVMTLTCLGLMIAADTLLTRRRGARR